MNLGNKYKLYIYNRDKKKCYYCDKNLKFKQITLDHYLPVSRGGLDEVFNLVTCCKKCNYIKGNNIIKGWKDKIIYLFKKAVKDNIIIGKGLGINNKELKKELLKVYKLENITNEFIFQSHSKRFFIKDNFVIRVIHIEVNKDGYI